MEIQEFINKLHRGGGWGYWWTRHQNTEEKTSYWWPTDEPKDIPNGHNLNVYFGVHATKGIPPINSKGKPAKPPFVRSQNKYIQQINCLFAEFDDKDFGGNDNCKSHVNVILSGRTPPSVVVASGGGYHLYWLLQDVWPLNGPDDIQAAAQLQSDWVKHVGGDMGAKDLARVLRVPGTLNYKYDPPVKVEILRDQGPIYDVEYLKNAMAMVELKDRSKDVAIVDSIEDTDEFARALMYLNSLAPHRCEEYQEWLEVGMALTQLGEVGLHLWDTWSKKSDKYKWGMCAEKWQTLTPGEGITIESLKYWALEDNPEELFAIPGAPKRPKPSHYKSAMLAAGWAFRQNELNDDIELNGMVMSDPLRAVVHNAMRERGYKSMPYADDSVMELAFRNRYHPIMDYLNRLEYDGGDEIEKLAEYFTDENGVFEMWLTRWLIGAIARIAAHPRGQQNRMLVLDGKQNLGKSYFVRWLASEVPSFHMEGPINPDDKDDSIRLMSLWVWEVAELGSTIRKADREALKFFISKEKVQARKSYGRFDTKRPAMASFIGTINNEAGFLSDPTGSRRFMVCTLNSIDWAYAVECDVGQVWARAYHLFKQGEPWELKDEEAKMASKLNAEYNIENPLEDYVKRYFIIDSSREDWFMATTDIMDTLRSNNLAKGNDTTIAMRIGSILRKEGCKRIRRQESGVQKMGWIGVTRRL